MKILKLDFATYLSEEELKKLRQYVKREFDCRLEDKLIVVLSKWLDKAKETIKEEAEVEAIMVAKKDAGVKIHKGGYPNLIEVDYRQLESRVINFENNSKKT